MVTLPPIQIRPLKPGEFAIKIICQQSVTLDAPDLISFCGEVLAVGSLTHGAFVHDRVFGMVYYKQHQSSEDQPDIIIVEDWLCIRPPIKTNSKDIVHFIMNYGKIWYALAERSRIAKGDDVVIWVENIQNPDMDAIVAAEICTQFYANPIICNQLPKSMKNVTTTRHILCIGDVDVNLNDPKQHHILQSVLYDSKLVLVSITKQDYACHQKLLRSLQPIIANIDYVVCDWLDLYHQQPYRFMQVCQKAMNACSQIFSIYDDPIQYVDPENIKLDDIKPKDLINYNN